MRIQLTCTYCGHDWRLDLHSYSPNSDKCPRCGDKNLRKKDLERSTIDYYQGSPPFPGEEDETDDSNNDYIPDYWD